MKCEKLIRSVLKVLRPTSLSAPNAIESSAVNKQFAVELIENVPPKRVTERIVACDGGHGALGHPKVYINLVQTSPVFTPVATAVSVMKKSAPISNLLFNGLVVGTFSFCTIANTAYTY
uniref:NADH dehydrogenase iron sulfur protein 6 n=1 Tax=Echinococcus granulosus TaxID=6210 RepID=A0A068WZC4_ECHGR|nr:NADH dehydrogenase iron sulfur protein 6 [Echinococcus granulosus]